MPLRTWRSALAAPLLALALPLAAAAQQTGEIAGRVLDAQSGRPLAAARVAVQGTSMAATSAVDGRYSLRGVPAGEHALVVTRLSYATKTVTGVRVTANGVVPVDVTLAAQGIRLGAVTATAVRERGSVNRALDEQRTATGIVNSTTREQIARSPDGDAARAVQRVSGVTVQDGRYVFVRGLGERYTTASLNGARIPSPDPERKVVPLDLFPSNLLEAITTSKTFTPDQPGDFSGASVNLRTREFPTRGMLTWSVNGGWVAGAGSSPLFPGARANLLGNRAAGWGVPAIVRNAGGLGGLNQGDKNRLISSFRNRWSPASSSFGPNVSAALTWGGEERLLGARLGYVGAFTYAQSQEVHLDEHRALGVPDAGFHARERNAFTGQSATAGVLWGGVLNLATFVGAGNKIELNNAYDRSADSEARTGLGRLDDFANVDSVRRTRLSYVERSVRSNQLRGTHLLFGGNTFDWSLTASRVTRDQPDQSDILYGREPNIATGGFDPTGWLGFITDGTRRSFSDLTETAGEAQGNLALRVGPASADGRVKAGGWYRRTHREADSRYYDLFARRRLDPETRALAPEEIFDGRLSQDTSTALDISASTSGGFYTARDRVAAGYLMGEWTFAGRFRVIGGARVERWMLDLEADPIQGAPVPVTRRGTDVLPSLALNVELGDRQNLRFSASQTLARPEYREVAPVQFTPNEPGELSEVGNQELQRTLVQNLDARWELYPGAGEVISFALFAKHFTDPIERIEVASTGANLISWANAASAVNYGAEVELRKNLGMLGDAFASVTFFTNATVMKSEIRLGSDTRSAATRPDRPMVGQAPYVLNTGVTYAAGERGTRSATLLYNVVGKRIWAAAQLPTLEDAYEMPRHVLDLSLRMPLVRGVSGKLDASNLLDTPVRVRQGEVDRVRYRTGRTMTFGLTWTP
ncbi:MAG TPA: TonB-dependent receptor [Longimicrobiaceae bacterium]